MFYFFFLFFSFIFISIVFLCYTRFTINVTVIQTGQPENWIKRIFFIRSTSACEKRRLCGVGRGSRGARCSDDGAKKKRRKRYTSVQERGVGRGEFIISSFHCRQYVTFVWPLFHLQIYYRQDGYFFFSIFSIFLLFFFPLLSFYSTRTL